MDRSNAETHQLHETETPLYVCPFCSAEMTYPLDWSEEGPRHWRVLLRCPECEEIDTGIFSTAAVEQLDNELDRANAELHSDLRKLTHENMSQGIEFFIRALRADIITPADF